jgi:cytochrome P450
MLFALLLMLLMLILLIVIVKWEKRKHLYRAIPGVNQWILRSSEHLNASTMKQMIHQFGSIYKINSYNITYVFIDDCDMIKFATKQEGKLLSKQGDEYMTALQQIIGPNILTIGNKKQWAKHRVLLNPVFSDTNLECVLDNTIPICYQWFDQIEQQRQQKRNIRQDLSQISLDVIVTASFNLDQLNVTPLLLSSIQQILNNDIIQYVNTPRILKYFYPYMKQVEQSIQSLYNCTDQIIKQMNKQSTAASKKNLLSQMIQGGFTHQEIISNLIIFMIAGYETTSSTLTMTLYLLATHKHIQRKAQVFVDEILGDRDPNWDDIPKLHYILNIIQESMRLYPVVSFLIRVSRRTFEWKGYTIPKDVCNALVYKSLTLVLDKYCISSSESWQTGSIQSSRSNTTTTTTWIWIWIWNQIMYW